MSRKFRRRKKNRRIIFLILILVIGIVGVSLIINGLGNDNLIAEGDTSDNNEKYEQNTNQEPEEEPEEEPDISINIAATGDIMFHPSQLDGAYNPSSGTYDFTNSFKAVKDIFQEADIAIANFEGTTAGNEVYSYQGYPLFNAPDETLDAIKNAGFDILSTVNNHCLDTRKAGVIRTIEEIKARGMDSIGTYKEKPENRVLIKEVEGIKLAFIAYTEMVNGLESVLSPEDLDSMVNIIDEAKLKEDIVYAKEQNAEVVIAYLHWGNEYARKQAERQEVLADMLFNEGVDIILGSHPHVIQQAKQLDYNGKSKFVAYSMGNFISNQRIETLGPYGMSEEETKYTEDGIIINIEIKKNGKTGEISINNIKYIPLWVYKGTTSDGGVEHVVYPIMDYIESDELNDNSKLRMNRSYNDTMAQVNVE